MIKTLQQSPLSLSLQPRIRFVCRGGYSVTQWNEVLLIQSRQLPIPLWAPQSLPTSVQLLPSTPSYKLVSKLQSSVHSVCFLCFPDKSRVTAIKCFTLTSFLLAKPLSAKSGNLRSLIPFGSSIIVHVI